MPNPFQHDEVDLAALLLFIDGNGGEISRSRAIGDPGGKTCKFQDGLEPRPGTVGGKTQLFRALGGEDHPDRHRLSVENAAIAGVLLDRVTERVAEVEQLAEPALALVAQLLLDRRALLLGAPVLQRLQRPLHQLPQRARPLRVRTSSQRSSVLFW